MTAREEARKLLAEATPGPWEANETPGEVRAVLAADGLPVARSVTTPGNTRLIAAAPRLLAALCIELDAAERGVRWEDVDLDAVTAVEDRDGIIWREIDGGPWFDCGDDSLDRDDLLCVNPTWFRDGDGWHKVAEQ